eukprot:CAMPEP_0170194308 /NCGR_PEP_ID=MMETSP0040_2-20121228/58928_1 /TAXON_ID=641309 /ORGANISM="Lotharella oceanica, Strain CCMP622" /LENGTH=65 /DNA_ID=CAMNT_0010443197 /DNA_START=171 /DNA_END=368 /DNA_ORIENTATION=-
MYRPRSRMESATERMALRPQDGLSPPWCLESKGDECSSSNAVDIAAVPDCTCAQLPERRGAYGVH